jgi:phosphoglycolate phosphatase
MTTSHMVGKGSEHLIRSVLAHVGADATRYDAAWDRYQHHYLAINGQHSDVYPGVASGLAALRRPGPAPGLPDQQAQPRLRGHCCRPRGWTATLSVVFGGDAFERKKPDPLPLVKTCEALGTAARAHADGG